MRRSKDKDRPHRCSNCQQVGHRKDSSQCPFYDGPTTDKPQNASLAKYDDAQHDAHADARDDNDDSFEPVFYREGWR